MVMLTIDAVHDEVFQLRRGGLYNDWMEEGKCRDIFVRIAALLAHFRLVFP